MLELEVLHELARIGTAIAERVNQQHAAAVAATPPGAARAVLHRDVAQAFLRIARAVRLTLAMFGRVRGAREALAAGAVLPTAPAMPATLVVPQPPQPSAGAGQRAAAETVRALARNSDELDRDVEAEGDKPDGENVDNGQAPAKRADGSNRPDRESLTELADFGFSLKNCGPGEVIARIYRDLGLPPDPARWPQAWPAGASVPARVAGRPAAPSHSEAGRSQNKTLPRPAARGEVGNPGGMQSSPLGLPGEGPALADGKSPHPGGASSPEPLRVSDPGSSPGQALSRKRDLFRTVFHPSAVIPAKAGLSCRTRRTEIPAFAGMTNKGIVKGPRDPRIKSEGERQPGTGPLPSGPPAPPDDSS